MSASALGNTITSKVIAVSETPAVFGSRQMLRRVVSHTWNTFEWHGTNLICIIELVITAKGNEMVIRGTVQDGLIRINVKGILPEGSSVLVTLFGKLWRNMAHDTISSHDR